YANAAAERAFGITRDALYGRTDGDLFPEASAAIARRQDERVLAMRQPLQSIDELELRGVKQHLLALRFPIEGPMPLIGGLLLDLSERVSVEQELRRALARKREFLATVAHKLRNPLAPIMTALNILDFQGGQAPDAQRLLAIARRQARQLAHVI